MKHLVLNQKICRLSIQYKRSIMYIPIKQNTSLKRVLHNHLH